MEHNFAAIIRARARCALPMPMEFHPVALLHIPIDPHTGAVDSFAEWDVPVVLQILSTIVQRLGGRKQGQAPSGLHYLYVCDTSRKYCNRAEPRVHTARILQSRPELVDLAVQQVFQRLKTTVYSVARELARKTLPISANVSSNPRVAMEIFLELHSRQKERGQLASEDYVRGIQTFKSLFAQYGHQELSDDLPELPEGSVSKATGEINATASGSSHSLPPEKKLPDEAETQTEGDQENLSTDMPPDEPMTDDNFTLSSAATTAQDEPDTGMSQMEAADVESELNNLLTIDGSGPCCEFRASIYYFNARFAHLPTRRMKANKSPLKLLTKIL